MIRVGSPSSFSLETSLTQVYPENGSFALGYFIIYINCFKYGVCRPDATLLACSYDEVKVRIERQGTHRAIFSEEDGYTLAQGVYSSTYEESSENKKFFGICGEEVSDIIYKNNLMWAPDGDQAFDDGSYVLQFDIRDRVRLIGFKADKEYKIIRDSLNEVTIDSSAFYELLSRWVKLVHNAREKALEC